SAQRAAEALVGGNRRRRQEARRRRDHARTAARQRRLPHQGVRRRPHRRLRAGEGLLGQGSQRQHRTRNFDELRYEYFRDATVAIEAFKADHLDWRTENVAKNWATAYDFPAVKEKRIVLEEFPQRNRGIMQAFAFNTRRDKFKDARLRRAFNFAYDFEEMNKQIFFGQYTRINSYFDGTELASSGLPQGQEL